MLIFSGCVHRPLNIESHAKEYDLNKKRLYETIYLDHFSNSIEEIITLHVNQYNNNTSSILPFLAQKEPLRISEDQSLEILKNQNVKSIDEIINEKSTGAFFMQVSILDYQLLRADFDWSGTIAFIGAFSIASGLFPAIFSMIFIAVGLSRPEFFKDTTYLALSLSSGGLLVASILGAFASFLSRPLLSPQTLDVETTTLVQTYWLSHDEIEERTHFVKGKQSPQVSLRALKPVYVSKKKHLSKIVGALHYVENSDTLFPKEMAKHVYVPAIMEAIESISLESRHRKLPVHKEEADGQTI